MLLQAGKASVEAGLSWPEDYGYDLSYIKELECKEVTVVIFCL